MQGSGGGLKFKEMFEKKEDPPVNVNTKEPSDEKNKEEDENAPQEDKVKNLLAIFDKKPT